MKYLITLFFATLFFVPAGAQGGLCPSNLDFELGDFSGWVCRAGTANNYPLPLTGPVPGRHTIIDAATAGADPFGFFPQLCPNGSNYSVKLGNQVNGSQAESISFTYTIPSLVPSFSMLFYYAVVLENPAGHPLQNQPRFRARIIDVSSGNPVPCVDFDFISSTAPGGFQISPIPGNLGSQVVYKDWTPVSINLDAFIGRTIMLEFITQDCAQNGHAGYAYLDVYTACNGAIQGTTICPGSTSITINAPFGYQTYEWYSDLTFTTLISSSQSVTFTPPPPVGTVLPVIVGPYPGYGCLDTLYATIRSAPAPVSNAGPDQSICQGNPVQIGGPPTAGYTYSWTPASQVSNPNISNPFAQPATTNPTEFIVTTTDILTGCSSSDTTVISTFFVDTVLSVSGNMDFCVGDPGPDLSVNSSSTAIQWYEQATGPIPGATGSIYKPVASGTFKAVITQGGCVDSTRYVTVTMHPLPVSSFTLNSDTGCVTLNSFVFTNTSNAPDNSPMVHIWTFSDGTWQPGPDASASFNQVGSYTAKLLTTTSFGCKDSTSGMVYVLPNGIPDFTWDSICTGRPVQFTNLSSENGSPRVSYTWDFNNGDPPINLRTPSPVTYNTPPGNIDVSLTMSALGCENDPRTIVKTVKVNLQEPGYRYRDITVPQNSSAFIHVRDTIGTVYNWRPPIHLSSYSTPYVEFFADGNDVLYLIDITDRHTCVTTDTIQMLVLKKPGYYLPSAFTPNNDGLNDVARPYLIGMKGLKSFSVFNRWGQQVFHTRTYGEGWDGKFKGVDQATGVYIWVLEFFDGNDKLVTEKGTITVIR
ncbi:MAG: PKD domain-containing protein [Chitinophagaceae bacterium]